jgi:hypothetical protein
MYKFPQDFDAAIFVGPTLETVCINANQVYLHFNDALYLCAECSFWYETPDKIYSAVQVPLENCGILQLLEHHVRAARIKNGDVLILTFEQGASLHFHPQPGYEGYRVVISGREIFI